MARLSIVGSLLMDYMGRKGYSRPRLAAELGLSYDVIRNLMTLDPRTGKPRTRFTRQILEEIVQRKDLQRHSLLLSQLEKAIVLQWEAYYRNDLVSRDLPE